MSTLERFSTPGNLDELDVSAIERWSDAVSSIFSQFTADFPQFYDPTVTDTPHTAQKASIAWVAFPARLLRSATSEEQRWSEADSDRNLQDEYCEWSVERAPDGTLRRVTFTSEVREYWEHVATSDPDLLLRLYHEHVDPNVTLDDLLTDGVYQPINIQNESTSGRLAHLIQANNNLGAAIDLAAKATVLRVDADGPVTHKQTLVRCAQLGDEFRNSDPQIAVAVNDAARSGAEVTLADPPGLYIDGLTTAGMATPDGADPQTFWKIERGTAQHAVRASFAVPESLGYSIEQVTLGGRPIRFGAQLADRVKVRLDAIVKPAGHQPVPQQCKTS
jgi:hypothetical protein